jgi:DNA-binding XRE family transcriptional regulator
MRAAKKKKLEAAGWKVGNAEDFLQLSDAEAEYVDLKVKLAAGLRARRQKREMTQDELARLLKSSQSRVAKMEAGDPSVSVDLLVRSLLALGATDKDLARIIAK